MARETDGERYADFTWVDMVDMMMTGEMYRRYDNMIMISGILGECERKAR